MQTPRPPSGLRPNQLCPRKCQATLDPTVVDTEDLWGLGCQSESRISTSTSMNCSSNASGWLMTQSRQTKLSQVAAASSGSVPRITGGSLWLKMKHLIRNEKRMCYWLSSSMNENSCEIKFITKPTTRSEPCHHPRTCPQTPQRTSCIWPSPRNCSSCTSTPRATSKLSTSLPPLKSSLFRMNNLTLAWSITQMSTLIHRSSKTRLPCEAVMLTLGWCSKSSIRRCQNAKTRTIRSTRLINTNWLLSAKRPPRLTSLPRSAGTKSTRGPSPQF